MRIFCNERCYLPAGNAAGALEHELHVPLVFAGAAKIKEDLRVACLRVFDLAQGFRELPLSGKRLIIGRDSGTADLIFDDPAISRTHAMLFPDNNSWIIKDLKSASGTFVNQNCIEIAALENGDNIRVGNTAMEFFRDLEGEKKDHTCITLSGIAERFRCLPPGIGLNCRVLQLEAEKVFRPGDTVQIGEGGIKIPNPLGENWVNAVVELEFLWPGGQRRLILGEVLQNHHGKLCIKLHNLSKERYEYLMTRVRRGSWIPIFKPS